MTIEMYSDLPVQFKECEIADFSTQAWYESILDGIKYQFMEKQDMPTVFFWACAHPMKEGMVLLGMSDVHLIEGDSDPLVTHIPAMMDMFEAFACILVQRTTDTRINPMMSFGDDVFLDRDVVTSVYEDIDGNSLAAYFDITKNDQGLPEIGPREGPGMHPSGRSFTSFLSASEGEWWES